MTAVAGACTGSDERPARPTHPPRGVATLRIGYPQEPPTLDPAAKGGGSSATRDILRPMLPSLFSLDQRLRPKPDLAAAWPRTTDISFDPFTVTVRLRAATWSDGKPITAQDVRFTWTKLKDGPTGYRYRSLTDVKVVDARRVQLRFDRVLRRWWSLFSVDDVILPAHAYSAAWNKAPTVSGGPFRFEEWTDGLHVRLRRNDSYWGPAAPLAGIDVVFVPDDETRFQLMDRGELDGMFSEGESNIGRRARARGFEPRTGALTDGGATGAFGPTWWELDLDPSRLTVPVALAVVEAVHPTLVAEMLEDSARPLNGIASDFTAGESPFAPWRGRGSLPQATAILDKGGTRKGNVRSEFQLAFPTVAAAGSIGAFIHFRLREVGVTAELVGLEPDSFEETWLPGGRAPAVLRLRRGADAPDAAAYALTARLPGSAAVDEEVTAAESRVDQERLQAEPVVGLARDPWADVQRGLVRMATAAPLVQVRTWIVARPGISGPQPLGASNGPLWNAGLWNKAA